MSTRADLIAALRVRPNKTALRLLREHQDALSAMAETKHERIAAAGLMVLIEMAEKVDVLLAEGAGVDA